MEYTTLGKSEVKVSRIALGTMMWGDQVDAAEAERQMAVALERGVNFWDTAEMYTIPAKAETWGNTERIIGDYLRKKPDTRSKIVLASKVVGKGERNLDWIRGGNHMLDEKNILEALSGSLKRLNTDYLDLYQVHWPDRITTCFGRRDYLHQPENDNAPIEETLAVLDKLVKKGLIRQIGISNETPWGMNKWLQLAKEKGMERIVSIQNPYNLLNRIFEEGLAEIAIREQCPLLAYSPLAMGVLSGKYIGGKLPKGSRREVFPQYASRYGSPEADQATAEYARIAREFGLSPAQMALAFVNSREFVAANIIGATDCEQLQQNIASIDIDLPKALLQQVETVHQRIPNPCP